MRAVAGGGGRGREGGGGGGGGAGGRGGMLARFRWAAALCARLRRPRLRRHPGDRKTGRA